MQLLRHIMKPVESGQRIRIYLLSDLHIGNIGCHTSLIKRHVERIAGDENGYVLLLGDTLDAVFVADKRYAPCAGDRDAAQSMRNDLLNVQAEKATALLTPLKGRILACLIGNHEETVVRSSSVDPLRIVATSLSAPYEAAYSAYVRLAFPWRGWDWSKLVDFYISHGAGGGALSGAKVNRVERRAGWFSSADVVASGHNHKRSLTTNVSLSVSPTAKNLSIDERVQLCFNTGGYLRGYQTDVRGSLYTERADLPPCELGGMYVEIEFMRANKTRTREAILRGGML